jgi:hypothetical protein
VSQDCDLCGDQGPLVLQSRCHFTAPLHLERDGNVLIVRCYLPSCRREVARFTIAGEEAAFRAGYEAGHEDGYNEAGLDEGYRMPKEPFGVDESLARWKATT